MPMWSKLLLPKMFSIVFLAGAVPCCLAMSLLDTAVTPVHHVTQTIAFQHPTPSRPPHPRQYDAFYSFKGLHKGSKNPCKPSARPTIDREIPPGEVRAYSEGTAKGVMSRGTFLDKVSVAAMIGTSSGAVILPRPSFAASKRSIEEVKKGVEADFVKGRYYVTGDLTPSLYRPDCLFTDPTTRVASVEKYTAAVRLLFDPDHAQVDLLSLEVQDNSHIFARWRLQGFLKFPWHPYVAPYTGTTLYTLDSDGLISRHEETWSISALDAALATITPTAGPRVKSSLL